jgi:hypothetical protein
MSKMRRRTKSGGALSNTFGAGSGGCLAGWEAGHNCGTCRTGSVGSGRCLRSPSLGASAGSSSRPEAGELLDSRGSIRDAR